MNMDTFVALSLEAGMSITGKPDNDRETLGVAFKIACGIAARNEVEKLNKIAVEAFLFVLSVFNY